MLSLMDVPHGFCHCGCGQRTPLAKLNDARWGHVKGEPVTWCKGHHTRTHGRSNDQIHKIWRGMIQRCYSPNYKEYHNYGGRGITICARWLGSNGFLNFLADMGERPDWATGGIDRYPNPNGNYEPSNCRWATIAEQNNNKRPRKISPEQRHEICARYEKGTLSQKSLAAEYGVTQSMISKIVRAIPPSEGSFQL